jgi:hypothetical protein
MLVRSNVFLGHTEQRHTHIHTHTNTHGLRGSVGPATQKLSRLRAGDFEYPDMQLLTVIKTLPASRYKMSP